MTVTDYYAPWCGPCKQMEPIWKDLKSEFPQVEFKKINVDENPEEGQAAGVMSIPTFIVGDTRLVGAQSKETLRDAINTLLKNEG